MKYKCGKCNAICEIPDEDVPESYSCYKCQNTLSNSTKATRDTSSAVGLIAGAALGATLEFYKNKEFEISNIVLVFLTIFAISAGVDMIYAALVGDSENLPTSWREYLGVAGMAGIGLSLNYVISAVKKVLEIPTPMKKSKQVSEKTRVSYHLKNL